MTLIDTIYLDMDGVLVDFESKYAELFGVVPKHDPLVNEHWFEAVDKRVFEQAGKMHDADLLLDFVKNTGANVEILSSCSWRDNYQQVQMQKIDWLYNHDLGHLKRNFVRKPIEKSDYATPTSVLIDDTWNCVNPFIQKGGNGILHHTAKETIIMLLDLINN